MEVEHDNNKVCNAIEVLTLGTMNSDCGELPEVLGQNCIRHWTSCKDGARPLRRQSVNLARPPSLHLPRKIEELLTRFASSGVYFDAASGLLHPPNLHFLLDLAAGAHLGHPQITPMLIMPCAIPDLYFSPSTQSNPHFAKLPGATHLQL